MVERHLGSYAEVARALTEHTGERFTRQGVQQMWKRRAAYTDTKTGQRRAGNGFPERREFNIGGHIRLLFDVDEVIKWRDQRENTQ